ncbi:MAG TPA: FtsQ-type POTRA domain-containing protein [Candidatus Angelobacter sp.]|nr:FtsQ-type POTRA domain-containing protein [Candidatus Angelobacter sp.]
MARDLTDLNGQDEPRTSAAARERADHSGRLSARPIELDDDGESQFLRPEKRVPVRRSPLGKKAQGRVKKALAVGAVVFVFGGAALATYSYGIHSWRFRLDSSENIEIRGVHNASHAQVMDVIGADIGRNVFFVPLVERKKQLEQIPWIESATVMRLLPDRVTIQIRERTPVAFVKIGSKISLIDASGVVLGMPANRQAKYSFPVIEGITETEPLSSRAAAMRIYNRLLRELDAEGSHYSQDLSEVDLSDPEDVKVSANGAGGAVSVHLGNSDSLTRYKLYVTHIAEWRQQFQNLQSVDLRYEGQIVVNPDAKARVQEQARLQVTGDRLQTNAKPKKPGRR